MEEQKKAAMQKGLAVFILLVFLSLAEFLMGVYAGIWWAPILAVAFLKAFFVVRDYMHIARVFGLEEE